LLVNTGLFYFYRPNRFADVRYQLLFKWWEKWWAKPVFLTQ